VVVTTNTAFPKFAKVYADTPLDTLKAWQAFKVADGAAPMLSKRFVDASFEFRNKTLAGQPEQKPRWKRGVATRSTASWARPSAASMWPATSRRNPRPR
jgi:putative endopeptidase